MIPSSAVAAPVPAGPARNPTCTLLPSAAASTAYGLSRMRRSISSCVRTTTPAGAPVSFSRLAATVFAMVAADPFASTTALPL